MKIYNIFSNVFYKLLVKWKSDQPEFATYFIMSLLIWFNITTVFDIYTYLYMEMSNEILIGRYLIVVVYIVNGILFYFQGNYKIEQIDSMQRIVVFTYFILSVIALLVMAKILHDQNV